MCIRDRDEEDDKNKEADEADDKENAEDEDDDPDEEAKEDALPMMIVVLTDERADRMRLMMPIRKFSTDNLQDLQLALIALHANFDRALDARYAIQGGVLWSVFIHPLESLTEGDLENAVKQVRTLRKNTGTTYTSSELLFGGAAPQAPQLPEELQEFD